ncbi:MAG: hypothetical protein ACTSRI_07980 [Promethearchaeota archaeon]
MSENLKKKIIKAQDYLKNFSNFIELEDFRSFLLFTLTSQAPSNILSQLGLGGSKDVINLPYNPFFKIYYQKINLISAGTLIIYVKNAPISDEFILEKDHPVFKNYLNPNEMSLAFRGKEKFLFPKVSDCSSFNHTDNSKVTLKIDDLFHSLESFIAIAEPNLLFVRNAEDSSEPDLLFTFNMMPQIPGKLNEKVLKIDVYMDSEHKTKDITYLKREEDYTLEYMNDIKEVSHAELYKSAFSLILRVKSLDKPY